MYVEIYYRTHPTPSEHSVSQCCSINNVQTVKTKLKDRRTVITVGNCSHSILQVIGIVLQNKVGDTDLCM